MNLRFKMAFAALLAFAPFIMPTAVLADAGQAIEASATHAAVKAPASQPCPLAGDEKLNMAQTSPADCCKGHKGVCGCRAGKIVCCDGTTSAQAGCTCHGEEGFLQ
jgi:hypothetical protein